MLAPNSQDERAREHYRNVYHDFEFVSAPMRLHWYLNDAWLDNDGIAVF